MTPNEAIDLVDNAAEDLSNTEIPSIMKTFAASMLLILEDVKESECACKVCGRIRDSLYGVFETLSHETDKD